MGFYTTTSLIIQIITKKSTLITQKIPKIIRFFSLIFASVFSCFLSAEISPARVQKSVKKHGPQGLMPCRPWTAFQGYYILFTSCYEVASLREAHRLIIGNEYSHQLEGSALKSDPYVVLLGGATGKYGNDLNIVAPAVFKVGVDRSVGLSVYRDLDFT